MKITFTVDAAITWLLAGVCVRVGWYLCAPITDALSKAVPAFHG